MTREFILQTVCDYNGINVDDALKETRKRTIVEVRQQAMYFCKFFKKGSLNEIGKTIGGKDHATVLHACKTVINLMDTNKQYREKIISLEMYIRNRHQLNKIKDQQNQVKLLVRKKHARKPIKSLQHHGKITKFTHRTLYDIINMQMQKNMLARH